MRARPPCPGARPRAAGSSVLLAFALVACGPSRGPGATRSAEPAAATPVAVSPATLACPAPADLRKSPITTSSAFGGGACPDGACPDGRACGCDAGGRVTFMQHTDGGARDAEWIDYETDGHPAEVRFDRQADGQIDARSAFARNADGSCIRETRDDDLDGTVETLCTYDHECLVGTPGCEPVACDAAPTQPSGRWCEAASCPAGARCACDDQGRVSEALFNDDGDAAFEARTAFVYHGNGAEIDEQRSYRGGALIQIDTMSYDPRGRLVDRARDGGADGTIDQEEKWSFGAGDADWTTYEQWQAGVLASQRTRTYRDGKLLTETVQLGGGPPLTSRYFPGAADDVVQPITLSSALLAPAQLSCRRAADCVVVPDVNCCDCSSGGTGVVVNRRQVRRIQQSIRRSCTAATGCLGVISNDPTCLPGMTPACVDNLCTLRRVP